MSEPATHPREPMFNVPAAVVGIVIVLGAVHVVRVYFLSMPADRTLILSLAFLPARYDSSLLSSALLPGGAGAQLWTFFTYALLHADATHLGINAIWLVAFGSPVARRFGSVRFLLFFAVAVAGGALVHLAARAGEMVPMIGASAGISGTMGAATRFVFQPGGPLGGWRDSGSVWVPAAPLRVAFRNPAVLAFVTIWFAINLLFGLGSISFGGDDQQIAWQAHVGGFLAGLLLFRAFDPPPPDWLDGDLDEADEPEADATQSNAKGQEP